jgi:UDP-glucose 4-epimerase
MKILITGGAGFIGSHIADALVKEHEVMVLDNLSTGKKSYVNKKARFFNADIKNFSKIKNLFNGVDYVFHTAAQARIQRSIKDPLETFENNVIGTLNVLLASKNAKVKKVVYSASSSAYGEHEKMPLHEDIEIKPKNPYALSKVIGEQLCKLFAELYDLKTISLRYFNVYGSRQFDEGAYATVIGIFLKQKLSNKPLTIVGDGTQRRDFTYISDVVKANILAMNSEIGEGEIINIGTGKNYSINEIAEIILGTNIAEVIKKRLARYIPPRPAEVHETLADISKAKKLLGWRPSVDMEDGLRKTIEWYRRGG